MQDYWIFDCFTTGEHNMNEKIIVTAKSGKKALEIYMKQKGVTEKFKRDTGNTPQVKVTPVAIVNGEVLIDRSNCQRAYWYSAVTND